MIRRYSIVALLLLAYSIVLAHSVIPHHHHDEDHEMEQTASHHHDDDDDHDAGLAHDFGSYLHSTNSGDIHQQPTSVISLDALSSFYIVSYFDFLILKIDDRPPIVRSPHDHIPLLPRYLSPKGLRAPPFSLA